MAAGASTTPVHDGGSFISVDGQEFPVRHFQDLKPGYCAWPIDDEEGQRECFLHMGVKELFEDRLYHAPVENPKRISDVGCGFGFFAEEIAQQNPEIEVNGVDLTPREHQFVPDNLQFFQADIEASSPDGTIQPAWSAPRLQNGDLVCFREVSVSLTNPVRVIQNAKRTLKPGGWIEFQESTRWSLVDGGPDHIPPSDLAARWETACIEAYTKVCPQSDWLRASKLKSMMEEAGFVNVQEKIYIVPLGAWPQKRRLRNAGVCAREWCLGMRDAGEALVVQARTMTRERFRELTDDFRAELFDNNVHTTAPYHVVFGQKPLN